MTLLIPEEFDELLVDMDGVLIDFEGTIERRLKVPFHRIPRDKVWDLSRRPDFYKEVEPYEGALDFLHILKNHFPAMSICSSTGRVNHTAIAQDKLHSLDTHFHKFPFKRILIVNQSERKKDYATPKTLLIDDMTQNVRGFEQAGGKAIHHRNFEMTLKRLGIK